MHSPTHKLKERLDQASQPGGDWNAETAAGYGQRKAITVWVASNLTLELIWHADDEPYDADPLDGYAIETHYDGTPPTVVYLQPWLAAQIWHALNRATEGEV